MKENNVKNIIDLINTNLDKLDINRVDKSITDPFLPDRIGRKRKDNFIYILIHWLQLIVKVQIRH